MKPQILRVLQEEMHISSWSLLVNRPTHRRVLLVYFTGLYRRLKPLLKRDVRHLHRLLLQIFLYLSIIRGTQSAAEPLL